MLAEAEDRGPAARPRTGPGGRQRQLRGVQGGPPSQATCWPTTRTRPPRSSWPIRMAASSPCSASGGFTLHAERHLRRDRRVHVSSGERGQRAKRARPGDPHRDRRGPHARRATALVFGVDQDGNASVTLSGTDADGDALKYYLTALPSHGTLSFINPVTQVETPLAAADLYPAATRKAIPAGVVIYTPAPAYVGTDTFHSSPSTAARPRDPTPLLDPAAVSATVHASENAETAGLVQPVALGVVGNDGAAIANYRWTLEEDLTYKVIPGVSDPNTLAVSVPQELHAGRGRRATSRRRRRSIRAKRYFVSGAADGEQLQQQRRGDRGRPDVGDDHGLQAATPDRAHPRARLPGQRAARRHVERRRARSGRLPGDDRRRRRHLRHVRRPSVHRRLRQQDRHHVPAVLRTPPAAPRTRSTSSATGSSSPMPTATR